MQTTSEKYRAARQLILDATGVLATIKHKDEHPDHDLIQLKLDKASHYCLLAANEIDAEAKDA